MKRISLNKFLKEELSNLEFTKLENSAFYKDISENTLFDVYKIFLKLSELFPEESTSEKLFSLDPNRVSVEEYKLSKSLHQYVDLLTSKKSETLFHYLNKESNLAEAQLLMIKDLLAIECKKQDFFPELTVIYKDEDVSDKDIERIRNSFKYISDFIPDKYEEVLPEIKVAILSSESSRSNSYSRKDNFGVLEIKVIDSLIDQIAMVFHEYLHAIELENKNLLKETNNFLKSRAKSLVSVLDEEGKSLDYLEGDWIHEKVGAIYQDKLEEDKLIGTEVLSLGGQLLLTKPIEFLMADPQHALLVLKFLKGKI